MNPPTIPSAPEVMMPSSNSGPSVLTPVGSMTNGPSSPRGNKKAVFAIIAVIILTITTLSGFILIARPVLFKSDAWNCGAYTFSLSSNGEVSVRNDSTASEPLQRASVYIDNQLIQTLDVPALASGEAKTLGVVTIPTTSFTWQINGTSDCSNAGRIEISQTSYQCQNIKAYSEDGTTLYTSNTIKALGNGSKIRLVAEGMGNATNYSAVRFTVNGSLLPESVLKTSAGDFYDIYTLPSGVTAFAITAQLKGVDGNWY